jgi:Type IV secretion system pilin
MPKNIISSFAFKTYTSALSFFIFFFTYAYAAPGPVVQNIVLKNPLSVNSLEELLVAILNILIVLATPIVVFFIIYAGYLYATARGNAAQVEQATRALTYSIIGGVLIIGAVAIAEIIKNLVADFAA